MQVVQGLKYTKKLKVTYSTTQFVSSGSEARTITFGFAVEELLLVLAARQASHGCHAGLQQGAWSSGALPLRAAVAISPTGVGHTNAHPPTPPNWRLVTPDSGTAHFQTSLHRLQS